MDISDEYEIAIMTQIMQAEFAGQNPSDVLDFDRVLKEIESEEDDTLVSAAYRIIDKFYLHSAKSTVVLLPDHGLQKKQ